MDRISLIRPISQTINSIGIWTFKSTTKIHKRHCMCVWQWEWNYFSLQALPSRLLVPSTTWPTGDWTSSSSYTIATISNDCSIKRQELMVICTTRRSTILYVFLCCLSPNERLILLLIIDFFLFCLFNPEFMKQCDQWIILTKVHLPFQADKLKRNKSV